ncbi:hypothetical protein CASFOL_024050 [Castilleja foliolosa]|uniref:Uncharacterized protein n=1 Tax=Castilleja foliolosa TaxID=1961234 RepID=A0ABD3CNZ7_9LAMI
MVYNSTLSMCSIPKMNLGLINKHRTELWNINSAKSSKLCYIAPVGLISPFTLVSVTSRTSQSKKFSIKAAASGSGGSNSKRGSSSRRVYQQSQSQAPLAPIKEAASFVLPVGAFVVVTFG